MNIAEETTIRLQSNHDPTRAITGAFLVSNVDPKDKIISNSVFTSSSDTLHLRNRSTSELMCEFMLPKKECLCMDISQQARKAAMGYSDGTLRFVDYSEQKWAGMLALEEKRGALVEVTALKFLQSGRNVLAGTSSGNIYMIYIHSWTPLRLDRQLVV